MHTDNNFKYNRYSLIPKKSEFQECIKNDFGIISQRKIAKNLGLGKTTVNRWAKEIGLIFEKFKSDEYFFDTFNEASSYLLGFIYADGNVSWNPKKCYYSLTITSSAKDRDHLEKFRNLLKSNKPLLFSAKTNSYRLIVNSKRMCKRLIDLGVIPNKSLKVKFPEFLPSQYLKHFIRGIIDGDGSINYFNRKRSPYFSIRIYSGSQPFLIKLAEKISQSINVGGNVRKIGKNVYSLAYECSRGKRLAEYIYSDADIYLKRKYLPYKENILEEKNG
ncbi:hypothetical protein HYU11_06720 [Candidatus Woesearchaeota archaeon]|nr:hypothetical protein [Candidatus Woesearchaeota archaeon]